MRDPLHEIHSRRRGRNLGVAAALAAFILVIFGLTVVKFDREEFRQVVEERSGKSKSGSATETGTGEGSE